MNNSQVRILVCDDDAVLLRMIELSLIEEKIGDIVVARNGREAIEMLQNQHFDLVVTDIHMPHYQGEDVLNLIRKEQKKNIPIIMMSSDYDEDVIAASKKQGVNEFIKKPIMRDDIRSLVEAVTRQIKLMIAGQKAKG